MKMSNPADCKKKGKEENNEIQNEVKKLNPELQILYKLIDRTLQPRRSDVKELLTAKGNVNENQRKIIHLEEKNVTLKRRLCNLEKDQQKTKTEGDDIENHMLEGNIIMHSFEEEEEETSMLL